MAITSKTQLQTDITASTFTAPQKTILGNIVDSYEDIFPQITTVQRDAIAAPTNGLIIYNTDTDTYQYWNGVAWFGIGQDLSTPLVVKIDLSSAQLLALDTTAIIVASAAGAGYSIVPSSLVYRFTYGSIQYAAGNIVLKNTTASTSNAFLSLSDLVIEAAANRSGSIPANTGTGIAALVENDSLELKAVSAITAGDGTLTVWVTYSIIVW